MASKKTIEAAVDYFAARSHDAWRKQFRKTNPKERTLPRMRMRGGKMVDINQPWKALDPKAKAENKIAAYAAYAAIEKFPNDREKASDYVHKQWMKRNRADPSQPKGLFKAYSALPEVEKDKDRAHIDQMRAALKAVERRKAPGRAAKTAAVLRVGRHTNSRRRLGVSFGSPVSNGPVIDTE